MHKSQEERRDRSGIEIQLRRGKRPLVVGHAAVFNTPSNELPLSGGRTFREVIRPGAFAESLASGADVLARFEHADVIGRTGNGTLRLTEDGFGLRYELEPADTSTGRDLVTLVSRGDIRGSSFSFRVRPGGDTWRRDGATLIRELRNVVLIDVAPVARPAYPATDVALRSYEAFATPTNLMRMRLEAAERA